MRVLGIDPGTAVLGYGVVESGPGLHPRLLECGTLTTTARDPLPARLRVIHDGITALIARHAPDAVAVESAFYGKNVRTTVVLSHARGVILLAAEQAGLAIAEYSPAHGEEDGGGPRRRAQAAGGVHGGAAAPAPDGAPAGRRGGRRRRRAHPPAHRHAGRRRSSARSRARDDRLGERACSSSRAGDTIVVQTDGGVGYAVTVPAGVAERLPAAGGAREPPHRAGGEGGRLVALRLRPRRWSGWSSSGCSAPAASGPSSRWPCSRRSGPERTVRSMLATRPRGAQHGERHREEEGGAAGARAAGPVRRRVAGVARPCAPRAPRRRCAR